MSKWKSVVDSEQGNTTAANSSTDGDSTAINPTKSDSDSFFDQLDYADVMAEMEADQELAMKANSMTDLVREHNLGHKTMVTQKLQNLLHSPKAMNVRQRK
ncbi:hypothetical protein F441_03739 [Phytophthora nicotianae CJ01A1]|uniref:Uncharacterized protein n=1 Tax=Phytophthora nicotianae CJ01A1 TaxID=1317063 RepID=W2XJK4_PHYNI|nr:hypothetical protein F441_03739 [Phytophthora nicotianae CJ01A1]